MRNTDRASILQVWSALIPANDALPSRQGWTSLHILIDAAQRQSNAAAVPLEKLLAASDEAFSPFCDPLSADLGMHRWLKKEREEAYSDWLAWVLEQFSSHEIMNLFGVDENSSNSEMEKITIKRELAIPCGRLDLLIESEGHFIFVIEVKVTTAEEADCEKQKGYAQWLSQRIDDQKITRNPIPVLLVTGNEKDDYFGFRPFLWSELCINLRRMIRHRRSGPSKTKIQSALILAFIGAVEQNLLGLAHPRRGSSMYFNMTLNHLRKAEDSNATER